MKKTYCTGLTLIFLMLFISITQIVKAEDIYKVVENGDKPSVQKVDYVDWELLSYIDETVNSVQVGSECTVHVKSKTYDLYITISDISWLRCKELQFLAWWDRTFG